jgi:hypothetical protein
MQTSSSASPSTVRFLAEIAINEIRSAKITLPIAAGAELVDHNGTLLTAMSGKIGLPAHHRTD